MARAERKKENLLGVPFRRTEITPKFGPLRTKPQAAIDPIGKATQLINAAANLRGGRVAPPKAITPAIPIRPPAALRTGGAEEVPIVGETGVPAFRNVTSIVTPGAEDRGGVKPGKEAELRRIVSMRRSLEETPLKKPTIRGRGVGAITERPAAEREIDIPLTTEGETRDLMVAPPAAELAEPPGFFERLKGLPADERGDLNKALLAAGTALLEKSAPGSTLADVSRSLLTGVEVFEQTEAAREKAEVAGRREAREEKGVGLAERRVKLAETKPGPLRTFSRDGKEFTGLTDPATGKVMEATVLPIGSRTGTGGVSTTLRDFEAAAGILPKERGTPEYLAGLKAFRKEIFGREDKPQDAFVRDWVAKNTDEFSTDEDILAFEKKARRIHQGTPTKKSPLTGDRNVDAVRKALDLGDGTKPPTKTESFRDFL